MKEVKKNRIYIGDDSQGFKNYAVSNNAEECTEDMYENKTPNGYISIPDLNGVNIAKIINILIHAKEIVFCHPVREWADPDYKTLFEGFEIWAGHKGKAKTLRSKQWNLGPVDHNPEFFRIPECLHPVQVRQNESDPQVWVAGCSFAHGDKLKDQNQRYGQVVANKLGLKVSFLTQVGSSNAWAVDQILKSDIRQDDVVIFGLTGYSRTAIYMDNKHYGVNIHSFDKRDKIFDKLFQRQNTPVQSDNFVMLQDPKLKRYISEEFLLSDHFFYETINHIEQLTNVLSKIKVRFMIVYNPEIECYYMSNVGKMLQYISSLKLPNIFMTEVKLRDLAEDGIHPGPLTHELYAEEILQKLISLPSG